MAPKDREQVITEETRIPLKTAVTIMLVVAAVVGWASRVESAASAVASAQAATRLDVDALKQALPAIQSDLRLIKEKLGIKD